MSSKRAFGPTGVAISAIGQGTWQTEHDRESAIEALQRGIDLGLEHVDTAEMYGSGAVEEHVVAPAIAERRDRVFLTSKVLPSNAWFAGTLRACEASLRRLQTDYLDLLLLHWRGQHPLEETLAAFEKLQAEGKIRAFGVSNFDVDDLFEAEQIVGPGKIACNQVLYHLDERHVEAAVIPWCQRREIAVVGYSPFGSGRFPAPTSPCGAVLDAIAKRHQATARQIALAFVVRQPNCFAIPKASTISHVEDNAAAMHLALTESDIAEIEDVFPIDPTPRRLPML